MISPFHGGALPQDDDAGFRQRLIPFQIDDDGPQPGQLVTVRLLYDRWILPEIRHQSEGSLSEDRTAIAHWEKHTGNPDVREARQQEKLYLGRLRDGMAAAGLSNATLNKTWRELKSMFAFAASELRMIDAPPKIAYQMKSKLVPELPKMQRETLQFAEVDRIWRGCAEAAYPNGAQFPAPKSFRVLIVLLLTYGPRTIDVLRLTKANVKFHDRLIQFVAKKTSKLQGLPLTDLVIAHLRSIWGHTEQLFPGFKSKGCKLSATDSKAAKWNPGYYTTWRRDILPAAGFKDGDVIFKHFRETMLTTYNGIEPGLGNWIAAHAEHGTSAKFYDLPTRRIREAIESAPVPACFNEIGG